MIPPPSLEGDGVRVVFTRRGDRYAHSVFRVSTSEEGTPSGLLLDSIEGTPDDAWPASPALKELHFEDRADGRLLVGMAGKSHWSLSVELDVARGDLVFDVACRLRGMPARLGSRYRLSAGTDQIPVAIEPIPIAIMPIDGEVARLVTSVDGQLHIEPPAVAGPWPRTVRWRYVVRA